MILVHHHRNMREFVHCRLHHGPQEGRTGVLPGPGGGLHDHRGIGRVGRLHDRPCLFQIVDIEGEHAVTVFGGVIQQLTHADECHGLLLGMGSRGSVAGALFEHRDSRQHLALDILKEGAAAG